MSPGPLMLDIEGLELTPEDVELLNHPLVGGLIYFARNFADRSQILALSQSVAEIRPDLLIAVDQEGGRVQRFKNGYTSFPPMAALGKCFTENQSQGRQLLKDAGWLLGAEVIASGVDFSFAPVLDLDHNHCAVIADRSFSNDPEIATEAAAIFISGLHEAGMAVTGKHFPGHGGVSGDSHLETPVDSRSFDSLKNRDLIPFSRLLPQLDALMPAHIIFPEVDDQCVGFSSTWLQQILRAEMGFDGVIFSDDLSMKGADVAGGYAAKAKVALNAGCDMVLVCNNRAGALETLSYLEGADHPISPRLSAMKARRSWSWDALESSGRRRQAVEQFQKLQN